MKTILKTKDKEINRKIIGFQTHGYEHLKYLEDVITHYNTFDIYGYNPQDFYEKHPEAYTCANSDALLCIHVPLNTSYTAEEYAEMIEDDAHEFNLNEYREEVIDSIIETAKKYKNEYSKIQLRYNKEYNREDLDGFYHDGEAECAELIKSYQYLTITEVDIIKEKLEGIK